MHGLTAPGFPEAFTASRGALHLIVENSIVTKPSGSLPDDAMTLIGMHQRVEGPRS